MRMYVAAAMLCAEVAVAAPAPQSTPSPAPAAAASAERDPVVAADWAAAPPPDKSLIRRAISDTFEEERAMEEARSKAAAIPRRYTASSQPEQDKYEKFESTFSEAKVPGCLQADGLKRQPTFFLTGLLALPFVAVAAVRGKCN